MKKLRPGMGLLRICKKAGLHGSFVSSVLKGHKHLSQDQVFALGEVLEFSTKEIDYLLLLLNYERAGHIGLRERFKEEIDAIQVEHAKTSSHISTKPQESLDLDLAEYYADPYFKIIHVFLGIESVSKEPRTLTEHLPLSVEQVQFYLTRLEEMGVLRLQNGEVEVLKRNYHLPKDFFICKPHQNAMKLLSQQALFSVEENKKESVCVTFSGEKDTFKKVHQDFLDFLKKAEGHVKKSHRKEVFQMNFDLHYWSK